MTTAEAREARLDLFCFPTAEKAATYASEHPFTERMGGAVAVFEETVAHFPVFFVAFRPAPPVKKFHERIAL
jgi:hypothetical protein